MCMCTADLSLQAEFLKLHCRAGVEASCGSGLRGEKKTQRSEEIELYAYKKSENEELDRGGLMLRRGGEPSWTESVVKVVQFEMTER